MVLLARFYLSGKMQAEKDGGVGWRKSITKELKKLGHEVIDPSKKYRASPLRNIRKMRALKKKFMFKEYCLEMERIIDADLLSVRNSDALIVNLPYLKDTGGTVCEIFRAWQLKKPIYLVHKTPIEKANDWIVGMVLTTGSGDQRPEGKIFKSLEELLEYIREETEQ